MAAAYAAMPAALPPAMNTLCESVLLDVVGLCVAARHTDYMQAVLQAGAESGACTMIGHSQGYNVASAALGNGTAAHGEDYDDTYEGGPVHAGVVIIPALLATAEQHQLSGGSMASGIIEYLAEGAWTKRMHPGWAAQAGYRAARMGQAGFTGPRTLFDGEHGFFHAFANSDDCDFTAMLAGTGVDWLSADIAFKPYACGTMAHPYIDCARRLMQEGLALDQVVAIECDTAEGIVHRLWEPLAAKRNPLNGYAAKFSIPYAIAVGLLRNDAGLVEYEESVVQDPAVRALAAKVSYRIDPDNPYPRQFTGHVRARLVDGSVREARQGHFRGGRDEPMSAASLEEKYVANCIYGGWSQEHARSVLARLRALPAAARIDLQSLRG